MLQVDDLHLRLPDGTQLCEGLSFAVAAGEVLVLSGPSGSGKSTLLSWMTGTLAPGIQARGDIQLGGRHLATLPAEKRRLGLMLQQDYLFPHMSVSENLLFGLRGGSRASRKVTVLEHLEQAGLGSMEHRDPATLSGGQRARVSLLRTLLSNPDALLLDEPFSRLDADLREQIRVFTWQASQQLPVLLVTHDPEDFPPGAQVLELDKIKR